MEWKYIISLQEVTAHIVSNIFVKLRFWKRFQLIDYGMIYVLVKLYSETSNIISTNAIVKCHTAVSSSTTAPSFIATTFNFVCSPSSHSRENNIIILNT